MGFSFWLFRFKKINLFSKASGLSTGRPVYRSLSRLPLSPHPAPFAYGVRLLPADPTAVMMMPEFEMTFLLKFRYSKTMPIFPALP
jgi:hypothetical protein